MQSFFNQREQGCTQQRINVLGGHNTTQVLLSAVRTYREGENIRKDGTTHQPRCTKEYGTQPKWPNLNAGEMLCTTDVPCTAGEAHQEPPPLIDWKNRNVLSGLSLNLLPTLLSSVCPCFWIGPVHRIPTSWFISCFPANCLDIYIINKIQTYGVMECKTT